MIFMLNSELVLTPSESLEMRYYWLSEVEKDFLQITTEEECLDLLRVFDQESFFKETTFLTEKKEFLNHLEEFLVCKILNQIEQTSDLKKRKLLILLLEREFRPTWNDLVDGHDFKNKYYCDNLAIIIHLIRTEFQAFWKKHQN